MAKSRSRAQRSKGQTTSGTFASQISAWAKETDERLTEVFRVSAATAADVMMRPLSEGGRLPVVSGRLRRSVAASLSAMPLIQFRAKDFPSNDAQIAAVIDRANIGQTIYLGFQAAYAKKAELEHGFVRLTAMNWQQIVDASIAEVAPSSGTPAMRLAA